MSIGHIDDILHEAEEKVRHAQEVAQKTFKAEIISLTGKGKVRVTRNWLYSALNIDPDNHDEYIWTFVYDEGDKIGLLASEHNLLASVRDDWDWYVQTQAPHSAEWLHLPIGRNSRITLQLTDLGFAYFTGWNGKYLTLNQDKDRHQNHAGYRIQSKSNSIDKHSLWFLKFQSPIQRYSRYQITDLDPGKMRDRLRQQGLTYSNAEFDHLYQQMT